LTWAREPAVLDLWSFSELGDEAHFEVADEDIWIHVSAKRPRSRGLIGEHLGEVNPRGLNALDQLDVLSGH
jgi:hypothetical protein